MKKYTKLFLIILISLLFMSCSQAVISFGEIGMRLPKNQNDESLQFNVIVSGKNSDYARKISGISGDTLILDDLDYGKYLISYEAYSEKNPKLKYTGETSASVYIGIFSPVKIELED